MCLYPRLIENRKYKANVKNGGVIPPIVDDRVRYVPVGCQVCIECRKQKARAWQARLLEEIKVSKGGKFVTLTFSNESLKGLYKAEYKLLKNSKFKFAKVPYRQVFKKPGKCKDLSLLSGYELDNALATKAVRLFLERWRKEFGKSVRHWLITELGHNGTENIHLHGIIWADDVNAIERIWKYGFVWKGNMVNGKLENYVSARTVNYMIKYVTKIDEVHMNYKSKILCSSGIGGNFIGSGSDIVNRFRGKETIESYRTDSGHKINMPIYWRNKVYSEKERELLWLMKLDKGERFVCGERIRRSDDKLYYNLLEYHRLRSMKLGYMSPDFLWKRRAYEEQRRKMLQDKRLKAAGYIV